MEDERARLRSRQPPVTGIKTQQGGSTVMPIESSNQRAIAKFAVGWAAVGILALVWLLTTNDPMLRTIAILLLGCVSVLFALIVYVFAKAARD